MSVDETQLADVLRVVENRVSAPPRGLPATVLERLLHVVPADNISYLEMDVAGRQVTFGQECGVRTEFCDERSFWQHYWTSPACYPDKTGDRSSVTMVSDFLSDRQLHSSGVYADHFGPCGVEHAMMVCLPATGGLSRRILLNRGRGPDFTDRDRTVLALLRPHLAELVHRLERQRRDAVDLTPRQRQLLELIAAGHSNSQVARELVLSPHTVRKHLENIFSRLGVTNRMAAVAVVFPDRTVSP